MQPFACWYRRSLARPLRCAYKGLCSVNDSIYCNNNLQRFATRMPKLVCRMSSTTSSNFTASRSSEPELPWHLKDQIVLKGMLFHGYHGALVEENKLGQKFAVDVVLWADLAAAGQSDALQDTIDYSKAYSAIQHEVEGEHRALQETVAERICQRLLDLDIRVSAVQVHISKPHVALAGVLESVGIRIFRTRQSA